MSGRPPQRLSDAWELELDDVRREGLSHEVTADELLAFRQLFYGGAAAMMAMTVGALADSKEPAHVVLDRLFSRMLLEISEYLTKQGDWPGGPSSPA